MLLSDPPNEMPESASLIPDVPYDSFEEYEEMRGTLIREYLEMVTHGVSIAHVRSWCTFYGEISDGIRGHWDLHGRPLFMKFTKGLGEDWCTTMNTMVVQSLNTAVRVMMQTLARIGLPMHGSEWDRRTLSELLRRELTLAIYDSNICPNSLYVFEQRNFQYMLTEDELDGEYVPWAQIRAKMLAFAMGSHARLGQSSGARVLGDDMVKMIMRLYVY